MGVYIVYLLSVKWCEIKGCSCTFINYPMVHPGDKQAVGEVTPLIEMYTCDSDDQGAGGAREELYSGMQTQPHHHLPNITTDIGSD